MQEALRRVLGRGQARGSAAVKLEYEDVWEDAAGRLQRFLYKRRPAFRYGDHVLIRGIDLQKQAVREIAEYIRAFRPASVLELGAGNGFNLASLAVLCPVVKEWVGVELTESGCKAAARMIADPPMAELVYVTELAPEEIKERIAASYIAVRQDDMRTLATCQDASFDFVFSHVAFEQLPREYPAAFRAARRVARAHACFIEEFREAQTSATQLMHLWASDYFRASYRVLGEAGFKLIRFVPMPMRNVKLATASALCGITRDGV